MLSASCVVLSFIRFWVEVATKTVGLTFLRLAFLRGGE
jgi:hypothetical protein